MSKISIKTDFQDGDKLFAADLNNNFRVIQAGVNANEENLEEIIEQAIVRLDNELIAITADRGWDWNGGDRVTFYKGDTDAIEARDIINGQLLYNIETGETAVDDDGERITTGSGNVVAVTETEPENPATKIWINPDELLNNIGTEVVNSMAGNQTNMAPSVSAVKDYVEDVYSTDEVKTNKVWIDNKPIYRKVIEVALTGTYQESGKFWTWKADSAIATIDALTSCVVCGNGVTGKVNSQSDSGLTCTPITSGNQANKWQIGASLTEFNDSSIVAVIAEYTKTTD